MGRRVKCPRCGDEFWLHGAGMMYDSQVAECKACGRIFNPRKQSAIPTGGRQ